MKSLFVFLISTAGLLAQSPLIPIPKEYSFGKERYWFPSSPVVALEPYSENLQASVEAVLSAISGCQPNIKKHPAGPYSVLIKIDDLSSDKEAYQLTVGTHGIVIQATSEAMAFCALNTLAQLLPTSIPSEGVFIQTCYISDEPRFAWRGLMLDVARHFFTKQEVMAYIDQMSKYKFNLLHLHLTDDNGWRLEIKSFPKLTSIGAWRAERSGLFGDREPVKPNESATYGGFYTQDDIREILAYAAVRHVNILPEIEMPGHAMAAIAAYPELSCTHEKVYVNPGTNFAEWYGNGKFKMLVDNTFNPADEKVYDFIDKVLTEVAALFPFPYIHIGGDECYHGYWEQNSSVKKLMQKEKLKDVLEVQSYFIKRVSKIVQTKGKKLIGWDEILYGGLAEGAAVMSWRSFQGGIDAARLGHQVVMSPAQYTYIDYMQGDRAVEVPVYASLSLKKTYEFDPIPTGVDPKYILGGQANLWTEKIPTYRYAQYMTYPRALAISESVWSPVENKNWEDFMRRVEAHFVRFDETGQNISRSVYNTIANAKIENNKLKVTLKCEVPDHEIYYTLDHTFPDAWSPKYSESITIPSGDVVLRFVTYRNGKQLGQIISIPRTELERRAR